MNNYHKFNCDLVGCCAMVSRNSIIPSKYTKDVSRIAISELEMEIRNEKEKLNFRLSQLQRIQNRLNYAKKCLIKGEGYP